MPIRTERSVRHRKSALTSADHGSGSEQADIAGTLACKWGLLLCETGCRELQGHCGLTLSLAFKCAA